MGRTKDIVDIKVAATVWFGKVLKGGEYSRYSLTGSCTNGYDPEGRTRKSVR